MKLVQALPYGVYLKLFETYDDIFGIYLLVDVFVIYYN